MTGLSRLLPQIMEWLCSACVYVTVCVCVCGQYNSKLWTNCDNFRVWQESWRSMNWEVIKFWAFSPRAHRTGLTLSCPKDADTVSRRATTVAETSYPRYAKVSASSSARLLYAPMVAVIVYVVFYGHMTIERRCQQLCCHASRCVLPATAIGYYRLLAIC